MKEGLLVFIILAIIAIAMSWAITLALTWLICLCFGWEFSLLIGTGVWLITVLLSSTIGGRKNE